MKKIKKIIIALSAMIFSVALSASCAKTQLSTPNGLTMDLNYVLTWKSVENARKYEINAVDADGKSYVSSASKTTCDLSKLNEGDYDVTVRAITGDGVHENSEWSEVYTFHRDKETGCTYKLINNNTAYEITRCPSSVTGDVVIEDIYRGKPVVSIASNAFKGSRVENLVIGKNVTYIGDGAFYNSSRLLSVIIPEGVTYLGEKVFQNCRSLVKVNIPEGLTEIKANTFLNCAALTEIKIPESVVSIGENAFKSCKALTTVTIPDGVTAISDYAFADSSTLIEVNIGKGVKSLGNYAFYRTASLVTVNFADGIALTTVGKGCFGETTSLKTIVFPNGVKTLGEACFYGASSLDDVTLPDTLIKIGKNSFTATKYYTDAIDDEGNPINESKPYVFVGDWIVTAAPSMATKLGEIDEDTLGNPDIVGIADGVFSGFTAIAKLEFPKTLKYVGSEAFYGCTSLTRLIAPNIYTIGDYAFANCTKLSNVQFVDRRTGLGELQEIGSYAFSACTNLKNNTTNNTSFVPDTVNRIGTYAFYKSGLWNDTTTHVQGLIYAGNWIVGYSSLPSSTIVIDEGRGENEKTVGIADYAFYQCSQLQNVTNLNSLYLKTIGRGAFYECTSLSAARLGANVTIIQPYTFYKCEGLYLIEFPDEITSIGEKAFYGCSGVRTIDLSNTVSLESIGDKAFYACRNVKTIDLGKSVKTIGNYAFYNMNDDSASNNQLTELVIPDSVTNIGANAFANFKAMTSLEIGGGLKEIGDYAFKYAKSLQEIIIPDNVEKIGKSAFYKCEGVKTVKLGDGLKEIGDYAFYGMNSVENLVLPNGLESIGKYSFRGWSAITSMVLDKNIETIGAHAFYGEKAATFYTDAEGIMPKWEKTWNSSYSAVIWNCVLSEDKTYVVSVLVKDGGVSNPNATGGISAPKRAGYEFVGWATNENSEEAIYSAEEIVDVESGVTLYAVWRAAEVEEI